MFSMLIDYAGTFLKTNLLPALLGAALFLAGRYLLCRSGRRMRRSVPHEAGVVIFTLYVASVLSLTFFPLRVANGLGEFSLDSTLLLMVQGKYAAGDWVKAMLLGNVLMLLPFGLLAPILWKKLRGVRVLPVGLAFILAIELLQPLTGRSFDIDDILLNFLGVAAGALLSAVVQALLPKPIKALQV